MLNFHFKVKIFNEVNFQGSPLRELTKHLCYYILNESHLGFLDFFFENLGASSAIVKAERNPAATHSRSC